MKKLMMLMSVPLCFVGRTRINVPLGSGRWLAIARPVLMSCQLINEKIQEQSALADALENATANNANSKEEN